MVPYDVRGVANLVLRRAAISGISVTNLSLNKVVYFLHVAFLQNFGEPLVSAKIEAWDHGPVFRELYHQFKSFGRSEILNLARRVDPMSGQYEVCVVEFEDKHLAFIIGRCDELLRISPGKLVDMSHVFDGPWHRARYGGGKVNPGMEISDELILKYSSEQLRH